MLASARDVCCELIVYYCMALCQFSVVAVLAVPEALFANTVVMGIKVTTAVSAVANGLIIPVLNYCYRV